MAVATAVTATGTATGTGIETERLTVNKFKQLIAAATHPERVQGRRLARSTGIGEHAALQAVLEQVAAREGLPDLAQLLLLRAQAKQQAQARLAAKAQHQSAALALKKNRHAPAATAWQAWFDGSAHPNPGKIGIGGLLAGPDGETIELCQCAGFGNSSVAEYRALIAVLEAAVRLQPAQLVIYGDSLVIIDDMNQHAAKGADSLRGEREHARSLIAQMRHVELRWIPRHRNAAADRLSQQAVALWGDTVTEELLSSAA
jgi:ribonuclease HI